MKREEAIKTIENNRPRSGYIMLNEALDMAITALQNQPVWIPVSERLPEKSGSYLTWVRYDNEEFMSIDEIDCEGILKEGNFTGEVVAWMPLPEPYRESEVKDGKV